MKKIILTGDRPTGKLHLGHYVGSLKRRVELQNSGEFDEIYIMIADAQATTDNADNIEKIRENVIEVALDYLACGLDPKKSTIFIQSQIPELCELTFYYLNLVTLSRLQRNPTVKQEIKLRDFETSIPAGFLTYPVSQAADITAFNANIIPVGDDQKQHLELTRDVGERFNSIYGETFVIPAGYQKTEGARIMGLQNPEAKMSKSSTNPNDVIFLTSCIENAAKSPIVPTFLPLYIAPKACAASSKTKISCFLASSIIGSKSTGYPPICTGTIIFVLSVIFLSTYAGSILIVFGSMSANTSLAPTDKGYAIVATNVIAGTITSSPGFKLAYLYAISDTFLA